MFGYTTSADDEAGGGVCSCAMIGLSACLRVGIGRGGRVKGLDMTSLKLV